MTVMQQKTQFTNNFTTVWQVYRIACERGMSCFIVDRARTNFVCCDPYDIAIVFRTEQGKITYIGIVGSE